MRIKSGMAISPCDDMALPKIRLGMTPMAWGPQRKNVKTQPMAPRTNEMGSPITRPKIMAPKSSKVIMPVSISRTLLPPS